MSPKKPLPAGLYAIADAGFGDPVRLAAAMAAGGAGVVQLRAKGWPALQVARAAAALRPILEDHGALLIINDHLEVARGEGVGLHLGADDGDLAEARAALDPGALLGRSTRGPEDIRAAAPFVDYVGFGPVFLTDTRPGLPAPRGLAALVEAVACSPVPVVAIGGINLTNVQSVCETGAAGWAVIRALCAAPDPRAATESLRKFVRTPCSPTLDGSRV